MLKSTTEHVIYNAHNVKMSTLLAFIYLTTSESLKRTFFSLYFVELL